MSLSYNVHFSHPPIDGMVCSVWVSGCLLWVWGPTLCLLLLDVVGSMTLLGFHSSFNTGRHSDVHCDPFEALLVSLSGV